MDTLPRCLSCPLYVVFHRTYIKELYAQGMKTTLAQEEVEQTIALLTPPLVFEAFVVLIFVLSGL